MSTHFHKLAIKDLKKETADCVTITFDIPTDLTDIFLFEPGQSLTIKALLNGEEVRRSYSICSTPKEGILKVAVKKVENGAFSTYSNTSLKIGDELEVMSPVGRFCPPIKAANKNKYLAIAAGSGITPVISIIKTIMEEEPNSSCTLIYGNKSQDSIIFFEEIEGLKNKYTNRLQLFHILSREKTNSPLNSGRIDKDKLTTLGLLLPYSTYNHAFICGPEALIFSAKEFLEKKGIPSSNIHFELFTTPVKKATTKVAEQTHTTGASHEISVILDGRTASFSIEDSETTILDGALDKGLDLPYGCKGGVCASCKARLVDGKVDMEDSWSLDGDEVDAGLILTCQSRPKSAKITVDFDI